MVVSTEMPDLIPLQDAATEFAVSAMSLHRYLRAGRLTRYKRAGLDHRTYVDRAELRKMLEIRPVAADRRKRR